MKEKNLGRVQSKTTVTNFRAWKSKKVWLFGATTLLALGAVGVGTEVSANTTAGLDFSQPGNINAHGTSDEVKVEDTKEEAKTETKAAGNSANNLDFSSAENFNPTGAPKEDAKKDEVKETTKEETKTAGNSADNLDFSSAENFNPTGAPKEDAKKDEVKEETKKDDSKTTGNLDFDGSDGKINANGSKDTEDTKEEAKPEATDDAKAGFDAGYQYGSLGAVLPDLTGKSETYIKNFAEGYKAGSDVLAKKLAAKKAEEAEKNAQQGTGRPDTDPNGAAKDATAAEANEAFRAGQQYGETGAVLPDLTDRSQNYIKNFADGFKAGSATRANKLAAEKNKQETQGIHRPDTDPNGAAKEQAAQKAEANEAFRAGQQYGETGAVLPDLTDKSQNYIKNFADGFKAGSDIRAKKIEAQKAEEAEKNAQQGIGRPNEDPNGAAKEQAAKDKADSENHYRDEDPNGAAKDAKQGYEDGYKYGKSGDKLPDLTGKSEDYIKNFAKGHDEGAKDRFAAADKEDGKDETNKEEGNKEESNKPSTSKPADKGEVVKPLATGKTQAATSTKTAAKEATYPQTGEASNAGLVAMGAVMMAAAAGFVAMKSRKEQN